MLITIFDKSFIQSLSVDEACLFDHFYMTNLPPIFFLETLGDLAKSGPPGRTTEDVVANLAEKTPARHSYPSMFHVHLCEAELKGGHVEMAGRIYRSGAREVQVPDGVAHVYGEAPEMAAFNRWQSRQFDEIERLYAKMWRDGIYGNDLRDTALTVKKLLGKRPGIRTLHDAKALAQYSIDKPAQRYAPLKAALQMIGAGPRTQRTALERWHAVGMPSFREFAPYTAYVLMIELFFQTCLGANLISPERHSNRTDIAYLNYLPFCQLFTSFDRLHERVAPLFLRQDQMFVRGEDLKRDLVKLDAYLLSLPSEQLKDGLARAPSHPPLHGDYLISALWDRFRPGWRDKVMNEDVPRSAKVDKELMERLKLLREAAASGRGRQPRTAGEPNSMLIERMVPLEMGKWRIMPPGIESKKFGDR